MREVEGALIGRWASPEVDGDLGGISELRRCPEMTGGGIRGLQIGASRRHSEATGELVESVRFAGDRRSGVLLTDAAR